MNPKVVHFHFSIFGTIFIPIDSQAHQQAVAVISGEVHWCVQVAAFVTDHPHFNTGDVIEIKDQEARLTTVQKAETVASLLHYLEGTGVTVYHHRVAEELRNSDR